MRYLATVVARNTHGRDPNKSLRPFGDWASFMADSEGEAVAAASSALRAWGSGDYKIIVSTIYGEAVFPEPAYYVEPIRRR